MKYVLSAFALVLALSVSAQPNGKKILLEKITSVGCPSCPWGGYILDSLSRNDPDVIPVTIHRHDPNHIDHMATPVGDSVLATYLWAHPTCMVDRIKFSDFPHVPLTNTLWSSKIAERKQAPLVVAVGGMTSYDNATRSLSVTINGTVLWDREQDLRVNAYIVEDSVSGSGLGWDQLNGFNNSPGHPLNGLGNPIVNYQHRWVLRDMLGGHNGLANVIPNPVSAGTPFSHTFTTTLDTAWNPARTYVVVLVQRYHPDREQREIFNAAKIGLNNSVLASGPETLLPTDNPAIRVLPNPTSGESVRLHLAPAHSYSMKLMDLRGIIHDRVRISTPEFVLNRRNLPAGIYYLHALRDDGHREVIKLVFR